MIHVLSSTGFWMPLLKLELADRSKPDGCPQIRRGASKEETIRRPPLPSTCPLLGGKKKAFPSPPMRHYEVSLRASRKGLANTFVAPNRVLLYTR